MMTRATGGTHMTPDQIREAQDLLAEYGRLESLCDGLQRSETSIEVGGADVLEALNFDPEAIMRMSRPIWDEVRSTADCVLRRLSELGVDVSEQRERFQEKSKWSPISCKER